MVMITGNDNTGRESLQNLILHKVEGEYGESAVVVKVTLVPNLVESLKKIRTLFTFVYGKEKTKPAVKEFNAAAKSAADASGELSADAYETLFQMWRSLVSAECSNPLVLLAVGGDDFDLWRRMYNSVSPLFDFIVVLTKSEVRAETTNVLLRQNNRNSAVIKARPLEANAAERYVREKLERQRIGPVLNPLAPFAAGVLETLYEPGGSAKSGDIVRWPVGWLNKTLTRALDEHLQQLQAREEAGVDLKTLPESELLIDAATVRKVREQMNEGN
jgi:hypothetical protein